MQNHVLRRGKLTRVGLGLLALSVVSAEGLTVQAHAQALRFNVPDLEAPGNRESAAQRSAAESCITGDTPLMAVVPDTNIGLATEPYPEFYVFVPQTTADTAQFVLFDGATNEVFYQETYSLKEHQGGIVTLPLPNNGIQAPLATDHDYYWYFSVVCDTENPDTNPIVAANVKRVAPAADLAQQVRTATPETLPALYADQGLWFDALASSAALGETTAEQTHLPSSQWSSLLESVGLDMIAAYPLYAP